MSVNTTERLSIYDRLRPHLDAQDLIRRLGLSETRTIGSEAYLVPLCHESSSGESLQVNIHTGRWNCKACQSSGVYGDLFQLVEYTLTGGQPPSRGQAQGASASHREALSWLCDQFAIPFDVDRMESDAGLAVVHLFAMAAHRYLLNRPGVLAWIEEKWGFDRATVEAYGIGFMPSPILPAVAAEAHSPTGHDAFRASGLGWFTSDGNWHTRFEGRVTFPYLEHGRAVYLIGRSTKWTPKAEEGRHVPKYHKLAVNSEQRPHISERVTNDHLYNEPIMSSANEVGIVEGVADAVAISSLGVPVISPVTISFNATDLERFLRKCRENSIARVWILFDNELSGSGNYAARRTGIKLVEGGLSVRIVTLPLGAEQRAARDEVQRVLGDDLFAEFERAEPRDRKLIVRQAAADEAEADWVIEQVNASKIDAAEWCARVGAGAPGRFDELRRQAQDVIALEIAEVADGLDLTLPAAERADAFGVIVALIACVDDRMSRDGYCGQVAKAAGRGVQKAEVARRVAAVRREIVVPARREADQSAAAAEAATVQPLVLLPPEAVHNAPAVPAPPAAPEGSPGLPVPPPPAVPVQSDHDRYAPVRAGVARSVEARVPEEQVGEFVAQTVTRSMGYTPFRTADDLYLVRGSTRIPVGLDAQTPRFSELLFLAAGLTPKKSSHRAYIAAVVYFLCRDARSAEDVSWSHVDGSGAVYFPTGDEVGRILKITPGRVEQTRMSDARVPAVAGADFKPITYTEDDGGIERVGEIMRWTSTSAESRLVLVYWVVCLPILRLIGTVPIMRIEGGSSSGKTRTVDAVSYLVNGSKSSSVPTAAAMISRLACEMLTIDDNREAKDVTPALLGTLLQATHLGAREKRKANSDTGTVIERISGALMMNGIEPIHDGKSEVASRMLTLRCSERYKLPDSPRADADLAAAMIDTRDKFWSESVRRCATALELDAVHGERIGEEIERIFKATRIGRMSAYLRLMYLTWVAGLNERAAGFALDAIADNWREAFEVIAAGSLESLLSEELSVSALRYIFQHGKAVAEETATNSLTYSAFDGKFVFDKTTGGAALGPLRGTQLARLARAAGQELNAPPSITRDLRAGQLEQRILDGLDFLREAGYSVEIETTSKGQNRYIFHKQMAQPSAGYSF